MRLNSFRVFFSFATLFLSQSAVGQTPGGVAGATLWLKADAGTSTTTDGAANTSWTNQMGGTGNATTTVNSGYTSSAVAAPLYQNGANSIGINFNPSLNFNGNKWLDGNGNFSTANVFVVAKYLSTPSANGPTLIGFDRSTGSGGGLESSLYAYSTAYGYQAGAANGNYVEADLTYTVGAVPTVFEGRHVSNSSCIATVNAGGTSTYVQAGSTRPAPYTGKYRLGNTSDNMAAIESGVIAEVVTFNSNLSATDRLKVQSYLALKYGITLGTTAAAVNYTASDATVFWTGSATYQNNVAGIARDDASGLNQKQSRSVNTGLQVVMGNGNTIATQNSANTNAFSANKSALVWGDNAGSVAAWSTTGAPASRQIIARKWFLKETGTVGSVKVQVADNSGSNGLPAETSTVYLLTDADGDFTSGATETAMTLNGTNWEANIDLTNGQFFTFATQVPPSPGGVAGAGIWLKADAGTNTTTNGAAVSSWADQSGNNRNGAQGTANKQPIYSTGLINFNPALTFDGLTDGTGDNLTLSNLTGLPTGAAAVEAFGVGRNLNTAGGWNHLISYGGTVANSFFTLGKQTGTANAVCAFNSTDAISSALEYASGATVMSNGKYTGTAGVISTFGTQRASVNFTGVKATTAGYVGVDPVAAASTCWNGNIAEAMIYPGNLTATQVNQVNSYLAIKYGLTKASNYLASDGTTNVWTAGGGYDTEIAGIARDDNSALYQKQSASESAGNTSGGLKILTLALGNSVAATNQANANTLAADKTFLVWGNNNGATTFSPAITVPAGAGNRMTRVWKATETLTVGNATFRIPASLMTGGSRYLVVNSTDPTFASGNTFYVLTVSGSYLTATVDLTGRANSSFYFSFAQTPQPGPGGVTSNLTIWLKADDGPLTSGLASTNNQSVDTWTDKSLSLFDVTASGANRPTFIENGNFNYNPSLRFDGTDDYLIRAALATTAIINAPSGTSASATGSLYSVGFSDGTLSSETFAMQFANTGTNTAFTMRSKNNGTGAAVDYRLGTTTTFGTTFPGVPYVLSSVTNGSSYTRWVNNAQALAGTTVSASVTSPAEFAIGANAGSHSNPLKGDMAEFIAYNAALTATQQQQVDSYLSIKYGTTKAGNYLASNGTTTTWTSGGGYDNDIAGIGADDVTGLDQRQSSSVNASNIVSGKKVLSIANGNFAASNLTNGNAFAADMTYLVTGNNGATTALGGTVAGAGGVSHMNRIWLAKETATVGVTKFRVPTSLFGSGTPYMYLSADATFTSADQQVSMTAVGDYYEASVDLTSRANTSFYFTFAELTALPVTLTLSMTASPATVTPTAALQNVVTVANTSANTAYNVKIKDQLPAGVTVGSVVPSVGTWDAATKIWTLPSLGPSPATATLTINTVVQ